MADVVSIMQAIKLNLTDGLIGAALGKLGRSTECGDTQDPAAAGDQL